MRTVILAGGRGTRLRPYTFVLPKHTLHDGLLKTIEWFRDEDNLGYYKPDIYNL